MVLSINGTNDKETIQNWFASPVYQVEKVLFAGGRGQTRTWRDWGSGLGSADVNTSPETIYGVYNADDYYLFGRGDGNDVIVDNQNGFTATTGDTDRKSVV